MANKELELVMEDVVNRLRELSHIVLNIVESVAPSPSLVSLAEIDSISMAISETRLVLNQPSLLEMKLSGAWTR